MGYHYSDMHPKAEDLSDEEIERIKKALHKLEYAENELLNDPDKLTSKKIKKWLEDNNLM